MQAVQRRTSAGRRRWKAGNWCSGREVPQAEQTIFSAVVVVAGVAGAIEGAANAGAVDGAGANASIGAAAMVAGAGANAPPNSGAAKVAAAMGPG